MTEFVMFEGAKQLSVNACGAFCVSAALAQLGVATEHRQVGFIDAENPANGYDIKNGSVELDISSLKPGSSNRAKEAALFGQDVYKATGNFVMDWENGSAIYKENNCDHWQNSPSALVNVAVVLGDQKVSAKLNYTEIGKNRLGGLIVYGTDHQTFFQVEKELIEGKLQQEFEKTTSTKIVFEPNHVNLMLAKVSGTEDWHWLASFVDPADATYVFIYDPASGGVSHIPLADNFGLWGQDEAPITEIGDMELEFPGLWISLSAE